MAPAGAGSEEAVVEAGAVEAGVEVGGRAGVGAGAWAAATAGEELTAVGLGVLDGWVVAGTAVVTALGFVTITTTKFFSSILYSLRAVSSLRILPA